MVGKAPTATGLAIYRALPQSANSKKTVQGKVVGRRGEAVNWDLAGVLVCAKKRRPTLREVGLLLRRKEIRVVLLSSL